MYTVKSMKTGLCLGCRIWSLIWMKKTSRTIWMSWWLAALMTSAWKRKRPFCQVFGDQRAANLPHYGRSPPTDSGAKHTQQPGKSNYALSYLKTSNDFFHCFIYIGAWLFLMDAWQKLMFFPLKAEFFRQQWEKVVGALKTAGNKL